ncbi:MAG: hypothetical protein WBD40_18490 [Tepidisphaeraceae bacterium]
MNPRRTNLLLLLLLVAATTGAFSWSRLNERRDDALASERDLAQCRAYLAEMTEAGVASPGIAAVASSSSSADAPEINRRLRDAASAAGAGEKLTSIEPGNTETVGESTELSVFLHLEPITIRELVTFLYHLTAGDAGARAKTIELEAPAGAEEGDAWVADVTIGYLAGSGGERAELR